MVGQAAPEGADGQRPVGTQGAEPLVDNPQTVSCRSPIDSPSASREKTAHGRIQVGDSYCSCKRRTQKVPVRFRPFSASPPLPFQALPPTHKRSDPGACPDPTSESPWWSDRPQGNLVCSSSEKRGPGQTLTAEHDAVAPSAPTPPTAGQLLLQGSSGHVDMTARLSQVGRLGRAGVGASEPLSTCPVASMATSRAVLQGFTDTLSPWVCYLGPQCLQRGARRPESRVREAQGGTRGLQGCSRPSQGPRGVSMAHWMPSTSSLPCGLYVLMFTVSVSLSEQVCTCVHTCPLLSGPGLAFLLVLHPQHQLPEEGPEGPGLREGTSSGRWWPWGGALPCPSQAPCEARMFQRERPL